VLKVFWTAIWRSLCASIFFLNAFAGGMDSGGGHGVVCLSSPDEADQVKLNFGYVPDRLMDKIQRVEFLDYHYAKFPTGIEVKLSRLVDDSRFSSGEELYFYLKNRLKNDLPELYEKIDTSEKRFNQVGISWAPLGEGPINDRGFLNTLTDERCVLVLMAYQLPVGKNFYLQIDNRLYGHPANSKLSQASLFLHEFLYLAARMNGDVDSRAVLVLVRFLLEEKLDVEKIRGLGTRLHLL